MDGRTHIVARLLAESLEERVVSADQSRRFRLLTTEGILLEIVRAADGAWYLEAERPAKPNSA
ncbi:MAG TPA: hypothetical protein VLM38_08855 [Blastocatellia bacterium]|nr:hypothetical protein [Blastocatellia bacterium]